MITPEQRREWGSRGGKAKGAKYALIRAEEQAKKQKWLDEIAIPQYVLVREASKLMGVDTDTIRELIRSGELDAWRVSDSRSSRYRISRASIDALLKRRQQGRINAG